VFFNFIFIPVLVEFVSKHLGFETTSKRYRSNLFKYFFFIIVSTVFVPITGQATYI